MDKTTIKFLVKNLCDILGIDTGKSGFDGFFYRDQLEHNLTKDDILQFLEKNSALSSFEIYEQLLLPLIIINPEKHQSVRWIYSTLACTCTDDNLKRHYYEMSFKHMLLLGLDGVNNTEDAIKFYALILTRDSCCSLCKNYVENKIYDFEEILLDFPKLARTCEYETSCRASVSVMSNKRYEGYKKRNKYQG